MSIVRPSGAGTASVGTGFHVDTYGAKGDGTTDDTVAIQAAVTAAAASVSALVTKSAVNVGFGRKHYRASGVTLPGNVALVGDGTRVTANAAGPIFTLSGTYNRVQDMYLAGGGVGIGSSGITIATGARWNVLDQLVFDNFAGRAVYDQAIATWASNLFAQNCLLGADTLTEYTGVYEAVGTDAWITNCELTASRYPSRGVSASSKACAFAIRGANTMASNIVAETSDHGVYIGASATQLRLTGVRGELCYGHGWIIEGGSGRIADPMALRNSQSGDNVGNGFHVPGTGATRFTITNAWSESATTPARQNYGIFDAVVSQSSYNQWINPISIGASNAYFAANTTGTTFQFPNHPPQDMAVTATPVVSGRTVLLAARTNGGTVTNFTGGVNGQQLLIRGEGFTTLAQNTTINNISGADLLLAANTWYRYIRHNGVWLQVS